MVFWINVSTENAAWLLPIHIPIYKERVICVPVYRWPIRTQRKASEAIQLYWKIQHVKETKKISLKLVDKEKAIWMHGLKPKVNNYTFDFYSSSFMFFLCNLKSFKNSSLINQINRFPFKSNFRMANSSKTLFFFYHLQKLWHVKWTVASSLY